MIKQYYKFYEKEIPDQRQFDDRGTETFPSPAVVTKKSDEGQINQEGIIVTWDTEKIGHFFGKTMSKRKRESSKIQRRAWEVKWNIKRERGGHEEIDVSVKH